MTLLSIINLALDEDLIEPTSPSHDPGGDRAVDLTGSLVEQRIIQLDLIARAPGVFVGETVAPLVLAQTAARFDRPHPTFSAIITDGARVEANTTIASIRGELRTVLAAERTMLNLICHLSGVATMTRTYVDMVAHTSAIIRDTRKTTPGLRAQEKYAVRCGGGENHRLGLWDAFLIKDNHLAFSSMQDLVARARGHQPPRPLEVEVDNLDQLEQALELEVDLILLDNMRVAAIKEAVERVAGRCRLEVSGGVGLYNLQAIAETGVDYISVGALTHSCPILDLGLDYPQV